MTFRVAHVNAAKGYRGGERQTELLIRALHGGGVEQILVARRGSPLSSRFGDLGIEVRPIAGDFLSVARATRAVDLIHVHEGRSIYGAYLRSLISGTPYIATRRVDNPIKNHWFAHRAYRRAEFVVGVAAQVADVVRRHDARVRARVVHSATSSLPVDESEAASIRRRFPGRVIVGHVGALDNNQKGQEFIIAAAREVQRTHPELHFVLVGGGADETMLKTAAADLDNLSFTGFVENVGDYLAAFDIFILPSRREGIGSILLDAMEQALPIVATRVGGVPEIVHDEENGILIDAERTDQLRDAVLRLSADRDLRARMGASGRKIASGFSAEIMAQKYFDIYESVLRSRSYPRPADRAAPIKALCITEDADRPTTATFIGLKRAGVNVTVACPPAANARALLAESGVRLLELPLKSNVDREGAAQLRRELIDGRYQILHVFSNKALQNGLRAVRELPVRLIAYRGIVGNVSFLSPVSWLRFLNRRIDRIVCVADAVRDFFLTMRPAFLRIPKHRLVRIYKGHDLAWYTAAPANLEPLGVPHGAFVVSCVANYRPRKGIEVLVDAMAALPRDAPIHLLLVGQMQARRLVKSIAASPVADRIHRVGHRADAPAITAASDVFVLPSIKREGLARSLIEAMAYAVAPIVTDCGGSPELVVDGVSGLVVPVRDPQALADAIIKLYEDADLRTRFGRAARERIRDDFRIEETIAQTLALYRSLV
jgi:glycosyltransferase involved in cell wall biosynthesis